MALGKKKDALAEFVPPSGGDKLIVWAEKRLEDAHKIDEFEAKQNLAFTLGNQWSVWDAKRRRMHSARSSERGDPNAPVRITANKIGGVVERVIARLTKNAPVPECRPVTDTMSDINTAKVATRILDHEFNRLKFEQRLTELYFWVLPIGWSFFHVRWDPNAGQQVAEDDEGPLHEGEVVMEEVPAFELRIDPNARRFRDARWCIRTVAMTREACYDQYGKIPDAAGSDSLTNEWRMSLDDYEGGSSSSQPQDELYVPVHQLWLRPGGRGKPDGLVFTWSGKTVLETPRPFPYAHGQLPFVPLNLLPALGGGPAGRTWVSDLVELQKDYNDARSREATIRRTLAPKVLAARGQIDPNRLTSRVEVVEYNPTGPEPKLMMPDGRWMAQYEQGMNRADQEIGERSGQSDVSSGQAATSAPAASILALQEADETKLAISARELASTIEQLGYQIIMLCRQFWEEERTIRTWSRDGQLEVQQYSKADIANQLDVHVSSESALPRSKSARAQLVTDLFANGVITDPHVYVRMLDLPGTDFLLETLSLDAKQAEREHASLLNMEEVTVEPWENHEAHYAKHNEFRKTEEYEALAPEVRAHFDAHADVHMQIIASLQAAQAGMAAPGQPAPEQEAPGQHVPGNPTGQNGEYTNVLTGRPSNPLDVAAGLAPSALEGSQVLRRHNGGIGGVGNPGPVPGVTPDTQQYRMGN